MRVSKMSLGVLAICLSSFFGPTTSQAAITLSGAGTVTSADSGTMYDSVSNLFVAIPTVGTPVTFTYTISTTDYDGSTTFPQRGGFLYDSFVISAGSWNYDDPITSSNNHLVDNGYAPDQINHFFQSTPIGTSNIMRLSTAVTMTYSDGTLASYPGTGLAFDEAFDYGNFISGGTLLVSDLTADVNFSFSVDGIQTVPEPSTYAMILLSGLSALFYRKKR